MLILVYLIKPESLYYECYRDTQRRVRYAALNAHLSVSEFVEVFWSSVLYNMRS